MNRIVRGASTFSKGHDQFVDCVPKYAICGDGKPFDTVSALGAQLKDCDNDGMMSLPSISELTLAEMICKILPFCDMVRYGLNGGDATEAALRYARAYTHKSIILSSGYHGCHSHWTYCTPPAEGCVEGLIRGFASTADIITYLRTSPSDVAGVIIEPVELSLQVHDQLRDLRNLCDELGIVLIFDEIITGLRFKKFCASNYYQIYPDLICGGKAWGDGYPLSFVAGKGSIMSNRDVFVSYTFAGFPAAIHRAIKLLNSLSEEKLAIFWNRAEDFMNRFNQIGCIKLHGYATRATWKSEDMLNVWKFWQEMFRNDNYLLGRAYFPKLSWTDEDYANLLTASRKNMMNLDQVELIGEAPVPTFKNR